MVFASSLAQLDHTQQLRKPALAVVMDFIGMEVDASSFVQSVKLLMLIITNANAQLEPIGLVLFVLTALSAEFSTLQLNCANAQLEQDGMVSLVLGLTLAPAVGNGMSSALDANAQLAQHGMELFALEENFVLEALTSTIQLMNAFAQMGPF